MKKACVIGWPISHSRSPLIHGYWLKQFNIKGVYEKIAIAPDDLQEFFQRIRAGEFEGCNVTLPHKETATKYVDEIDQQARLSGTINTVYDQGGKLMATSTDGMGFIANIRQNYPNFTLQNKTILILGAGGSSRAIIAELLRHNTAEIGLWNRTESKTDFLVQQFGKSLRSISTNELAHAAASTDLLINTTSVGIVDSEQLSFPFSHLPDHAIVSDITYTPLITAFLAAARQRQLKIVPGLGMLLHQAVPGFAKWFGVTPTVTAELYDLVARDIDDTFTAQQPLQPL